MRQPRVKITMASTTTIAVEAPYNTVFVEAARKLGGKWTPPVWRFDAADAERVRNACLHAYGDDGEKTDQVTLRMTIHPTTGEESRVYCDSLKIHGRPLVRAYDRDGGARLCDGVVLLSGHVTSGGSRKNWATVVAGKSVLLVRDFPRAVAEDLVARSLDGKTNHGYAIEREEAEAGQAATDSQNDAGAAAMSKAWLLETLGHEDQPKAFYRDHQRSQAPIDRGANTSRSTL